MRQTVTVGRDVRHPGAGHGFHCDSRDSFHEVSARDAWGRPLDCVAAHLAKA